MAKIKYPHFFIDNKEFKVCNTCKEAKELGEYSKRSIAYDGLDIRCCTCTNLYRRSLYKTDKDFRIKQIKRNKQWAKNNPEKIREINKRGNIKYRERNKEYLREWHRKNKERIKWDKVLKTYGLTKEDWMKIFESQGSVCAICRKKEEETYAFNVDHDHRTNKIRGILCTRCNLVLTTWTEDMLERCIDYLKRTNL